MEHGSNTDKFIRHFTFGRLKTDSERANFDVISVSDPCSIRG